MATPLDGFRIVDASTGIAGPMAGMLLADFGADVVKVEPPGGEPGRANPGFVMWNRGKRGITVDPEIAEQRARLDALLRGADLCIFSQSTERLAALGLDPKTVTDANPALVYLHMPPFSGPTPWAGDDESAALVAATTGVAIEQYAFDNVPVDGIYPHTLYGQAIWAATAATATLIEREQSGFGQTLTVSGLHGMLMTMSGQVTHLPGAEYELKPGGPGGPVAFYRLYEGSDGCWLFMATLTPKFFMAAFEVLGVLDLLADERLGGEPMAMALPENAPWVIDRVQAAFRKRPRDEWLTALRAVGCPVAPADNRDDWLDHEQLRAIGMRLELDDAERGRVVMPGISLKLIDTPGAVRGSAPSLGQHNATLESWAPKPAPSGQAPTAPGPLHGRRVLDLGSIIAGTYAGSLLAELGADVIKVEAPDGDILRGFGPTFVGYNKGKRSVVINLRDDAGREAFYDLVKTADVVIDNYRNGVLERLQIDYDSLRRVNPKVITASVTGFGEGGPLDDFPGWDPMVQAWSGMMRAQGGDSAPVFFNLPVNDVSSACMAAYGICLALLHRDRTGDGQRLWTCLAAQGAFMQAGELVRYEGRPPARLGGRDFAGPRALDRFYAVQDGWIRLQATTDDAVAALRRSGLLGETDPDDEAAIAEALQSAFGSMTREEVVTQLRDAGVPAAPARPLQDLALNPAFDGLEAVHLHTPDRGAAVFSVGRYARLSRTEQPGVLYPPGLGEHSREVLGEAGLSAEAIDALLSDGVVSQNGPFAL